MMHGKKIEKNKTHQKIMKLPHDEIESKKEERVRDKNITSP